MTPSRSRGKRRLTWYRRRESKQGCEVKSWSERDGHVRLGKPSGISGASPSHLDSDLTEKGIAQAKHWQ